LEKNEALAPPAGSFRTIDLGALPALKLPDAFFDEVTYFKTEKFTRRLSMMNASRLWPQFKAGVLAHAAMIDGLLGDAPRFHLGRDGAWQYYASRLLAPEVDNRLVYVSRSILRSPELQRYLKEQGIADGALFFDTGYNGTIITAVRKLFP